MTRAIGVVAAVAVLGGCSSVGTGRSAAAPPLVVCGTTLSATPAGPVLVEVTRRPVTVDAASVGGRIYLRVASECAGGADVTVPPGAAAVVASAPARDGRPAALVLAPLQQSFDVTVAHPGGDAYGVAVRLGG